MFWAKISMPTWDSGGNVYSPRNEATCWVHLAHTCVTRVAGCGQGGCALCARHETYSIQKTKTKKNAETSHTHGKSAIHDLYPNPCRTAPIARARGKSCLELVWDFFCSNLLEKGGNMIDITRSKDTRPASIVDSRQALVAAAEPRATAVPKGHSRNHRFPSHSE